MQTGSGKQNPHNFPSQVSIHLKTQSKLRDAPEELPEPSFIPFLFSIWICWDLNCKLQLQQQVLSSAVAGRCFRRRWIHPGSVGFRFPESLLPPSRYPQDIFPCPAASQPFPVLLFLADVQGKCRNAKVALLRFSLPKFMKWGSGIRREHRWMEAMDG